MKEKNNHSEEVLIARFAKAMGHPTRIAILQFLAKQESCFFGEIHEELPIAKATVSQHLKKLKEAGLIQGEIEGPKVKYCINQVNWKIANNAFRKLFQECRIKDICC
ncbi:MAG: winged helix-turn-helix transcriptional regulator [Bacteroidales bacterium]|jgi:DNA-binding transcriptional ArsR family regulator|nr:winged helix-turn-helix transcriptional regulator [Bacteroidales bacterium]